jgi:hypothetical protein
MPPGIYHLKAGFTDSRGDVGQFALPADGSVLGVKGPLVEASQPANVPDSLLAPDLGLRGYDISPLEIIPGEGAWVTLDWQAIERPQEDYMIVLRLLGEAGEVASWSGRPFYNTFPTRQWPANASVRDPWRISVPDDLSPGSYQLWLGLRNASSAAELTHFNLGTIRVVERRVSFEVPPMQFQVDYTFDGIATLVGYDLLGDLLPSGARVRVTLYWRALEATERPYTVRVRLVDTEGLVLAEQESQPAGGTVPTHEWRSGEILTDLHQLDAGKGPDGTVNLEVEFRDGEGNAVPLADGSEKLVIPDVQQKVMWRVSSP